jgi:hypothetical protein
MDGHRVDVLLTRQLQGQNVKLLPVRLSGGTIPPILADIKFADLVSDWDGGIKNLLQVLT